MKNMANHIDGLENQNTVPVCRDSGGPSVIGCGRTPMILETP